MCHYIGPVSCVHDGMALRLPWSDVQTTNGWEERIEALVTGWYRKRGQAERYLVRSAYEVKIVFGEELRDAVWAEGVRDASVVLSPTLNHIKMQTDAQHVREENQQCNTCPLVQPCLRRDAAMRCELRQRSAKRTKDTKRG
jgi:hypothetical protein